MHEYGIIVFEQNGKFLVVPGEVFTTESQEQAQQKMKLFLSDPELRTSKTKTRSRKLPRNHTMIAVAGGTIEAPALWFAVPHSLVCVCM